MIDAKQIRVPWLCSGSRIAFWRVVRSERFWVADGLKGWSGVTFVMAWAARDGLSAAGAASTA
jgi:hypothetical protein